MAAPDAPQTGESRLLNPRRSAHATIRGYLYQTCLGVLRWLDLQPNEILLCEGDEDLDRFLLGGGAVSEQVKAYSGSLSLSDRAVLESLGNFLRSYVALRKRGETRRFVFTTTAQEKRVTAKGLNFDLLADWNAGKRTKKVVSGVRSLLKPQKKTDRHWQETTDDIAWLDSQPEGWKSFMDAVEWSFDAPDLAAVRQRIKDRLALREGTSALPAETFLERLISHVLHTSMQPSPEDRRLTPKALSDLVETARADLGNWVKTPAAERLLAVFDELQQIHRLLSDNVAKLPKNAAPGKLLTAAYEVIPFDQEGRREELDFLTDWCKSSERKSVLLLTGEGGSGKTRLMIEWCRHLRHQDWHAGFLRRDREADDLDPLLEGVAPRLVVVDYAETLLEIVEPLLLKMGLTSESGGARLRLVLLARRPSEWWANLSRKGREVEDLLSNSPEPLALTPLIPKDVEERTKAFKSAVEGFSLQVGRKPSRKIPIPDLNGKNFERVLYLHMAALAALRGERIESAESALQQTLAHERFFWNQQVSSLGLDGIWAPRIKEALAYAVAAITLVGGTKSHSHTQKILDRTLRGNSLQTHHIGTLIDLCRHLYMGLEEDGRYIDPLQPDLLGEELIATLLNSDRSFLDRLLDNSLPEGHAVLTTLTRLAQRRPELKSWLHDVLSGSLNVLAQVAMNVAVETGDPIGLSLAEALSQTSDHGLILRIQKLCENERFAGSVPLHEVALITTERTLEIIKAEGLITDFDQIKFARLSCNLGLLLRESGILKEALAAMEEAISIQRRLAPRIPWALSDYAVTLNRISILLGEFGHTGRALRTAQRAVAIRRKLTKSDPVKFAPKLASSLNNLSIQLSSVGQLKMAMRTMQKAVEMRRTLAKQGPNFLRDGLATSLTNLGILLGRLNNPDLAIEAIREAVQIRQELAKERPDVYLPDLSVSLTNLSFQLRKLGLYKEALGVEEDAIEIQRKLTEWRPEGPVTNLAFSLENLGLTLYQMGRLEEATRARSESSAIRARVSDVSREPDTQGGTIPPPMVPCVQQTDPPSREPYAQRDIPPPMVPCVQADPPSRGGGDEPAERKNRNR